MRLNPIKGEGSLDRTEFTPKKWYPVGKTKEKVHVMLTPGGASKRRVIYVFRNKDTDELLIGKTEQLVRRRISKYNYSFNHPEKEVGRGRFPKAVAAHPEKFEFAILHELKKNEDLDWYEKALIIAYNSIQKGYNQNRGGGGGQARPPATPTPKGSSPKPLPDTPNKYYDISVNSEGMVSVQLTPGAKAKKNVIYVIKNDTKQKYYIGMSNLFARRVKEHVNYSNNPSSEKGQGALPSSIRRSPRHFKAGILAEGVSNLPEKEVEAIKNIGKRAALYNKNRGGGGSSGGSPGRPSVARQLKF